MTITVTTHTHTHSNRYGWRSFLDPKINGIEVDRTRDKWMRHAAKMGLAEAQFKIARNELGGATSHNIRDIPTVRHWLELSIQGGEADAMYQLGHLLLEDADDDNRVEVRGHNSSLSDDTTRGMMNEQT